MGYTDLIGIVLVGIQGLMAYLSVSFNGKDYFGKSLQTIFLLLCVGLIPLDIGVLKAVLVAESVTDANLLSLIDSVYVGSVWFVVIFVALIFIRLLYTGLVRPLQDIEHPDKAFTGSVIR
jgi:hypothetical protein